MDIYQNGKTRHVFVTGLTGSGKTNTTHFALKQLSLKNVPFMVIEPAKTEYRKMLNTEIGESLWIFTVGNETLSPFRLNPFQFPMGIHIQTHIDRLKALLTSTWSLFGPTPEVLEKCILQIYQKKGWNLVTSQNYRGNHADAFPTLTDLYEIVDGIVDDLRYKPDTTAEIKAALKVRINNLRLGAKGQVFDTNLSFPIEELMNRPSIFELEHIGDDRDKALVMGLLLISVYEYYLAQGVTEGDNRLRHVMVIEEAHRLLKNAPTSVNPEFSNVEHASVEMFSNLISEIRAYGQGLFIVEQIPTKLVSDVIKQTDIKILHRLVATDERNVMAGAMNATRKQVEHIVSLATGEAFVKLPERDVPTLVEVPYSKVPTLHSKKEEHEQIMETMQPIIGRNPEVYSPLYPFVPSTLQNISIYAESQLYAEENNLREAVAKWILSTVLDGGTLFTEEKAVFQAIQSQITHRKNEPLLFQYTLFRSIHHYFSTLSQEHGWPFENTQQITESFIDIVNVSFFNPQSNEVSLDELSKQIFDFRRNYQELVQLKIVPYPLLGCQKICPQHICLYRYNARRFLSDSRFDQRFRNRLAQGNDDEPQKWADLFKVCQSISKRVIGDRTENRQFLEAATYCVAIQKTISIDSIGLLERKKIMTNLLGMAETSSS